ncbi:MAG: hypothetical protein NYU90_06250 [Aigarchaeota archaeon]|nr:hypothetical protein [Candidatus Calditenuis fumarioli]
MQELLGALSIASALVVLVLIWVTAKPVRRHGTPTAAWRAEERVAVTRQAHREPEAKGLPEERAEAVEMGKEAAEEKPATEQQPTSVEGGSRQQGSETQEVAADAGQQETVSSDEEVEEELVRELSETLSLYRQLLEELNKLKSGGGSK